MLLANFPLHSPAAKTVTEKSPVLRKSLFPKTTTETTTTTNNPYSTTTPTTSSTSSHQPYQPPSSYSVCHHQNATPHHPHRCLTLHLRKPSFRQRPDLQSWSFELHPPVWQEALYRHQGAREALVLCGMNKYTSFEEIHCFAPVGVGVVVGWVNIQVLGKYNLFPTFENVFDDARLFASWLIYCSNVDW